MLMAGDDDGEASCYRQRTVQSVLPVIAFFDCGIRGVFSTTTEEQESGSRPDRRSQATFFLPYIADALPYRISGPHPAVQLCFSPSSKLMRIHVVSWCMCRGVVM